MASAAPMIGAVRYTQRFSIWPDRMAGASDLAGFMEAPQIGPANMASRPMTEPMAIPAVIPFSFAPTETLRMTSISRKERIVSRTKL